MRNPDALPYECPECEARTRANTRTGLLYSHQVPGETRACLVGGTPVLPVRPDDPPELPPLRQAAEKVRPAERNPYGERSAVCMRCLAVFLGCGGRGSQRFVTGGAMDVRDLTPGRDHRYRIRHPAPVCKQGGAALQPTRAADRAPPTPRSS